ncbi:hypothetical protein CARUB_v10009391mg [Capsella rubella]|uniref:KIB1-4 beta-propeller domain-containing protein n=1 Tax=Capsella rubella TaxID=81985 RepID=R0I6H4_9BRAS|nr:F-box protein At5g25290 [Capsella rubella]EOA37924.1 hypothetical protein CARUB_v10009391mg [Capsella rubella]
MSRRESNPSLRIMEISTLKRPSSSPDLQSSKAVRSTLILQPKFGSPLLMLSLEKGGCRVYNPADDMVYETKSDLSGYRFLASSGKWFLVIDPRLKLYIIDVFSEERIELPALETFKGTIFKLERLGEDKIRNVKMCTFSCFGSPQTAEDVRGFLWVDDKKGDYVVLWRFEYNEYLAFCKKGDDHYREIPTRVGVRMDLQGLRDMLLTGYNLYIFSSRNFIRHLDLSGGHDGFTDVSVNHRHPMWLPPLGKDERERIRKYQIHKSTARIAVTRSGEVLYVETYMLNSGMGRMFHLYKRDPKDLDPNTINTLLVEVHSLGDEALFLDLGITVPADHTLGIEPNSIYFTRADHIFHHKSPSIEICVFSLTTKTFKHFPIFDGSNIKDAKWFLPS